MGAGRHGVRLRACRSVSSRAESVGGSAGWPCTRPIVAALAASACTELPAPAPAPGSGCMLTCAGELGTDPPLLRHPPRRQPLGQAPAQALQLSRREGGGGRRLGHCGARAAAAAHGGGPCGSLRHWGGAGPRCSWGGEGDAAGTARGGPRGAAQWGHGSGAGSRLVCGGCSRPGQAGGRLRRAQAGRGGLGALLRSAALVGEQGEGAAQAPA